MKFVKTVLKNFRILFRRKTSLLAIILGPLLVIALIGFAFNSSSQFQISVGYVSVDDSVLTTEFIDSLKQEYKVVSFPSRDECASHLEQGLTHMCIIFPEDFVIEQDKTNNISFIVDKSRVNIVYSILSNVNERIGVKSDQLSKDLTQTLLNTLDSTSSDLDTNLGSLIRLKKSVQDSQSHTDSASSSLATINLNTESISLNSLSDAVNSLESSGTSVSVKGKKTAKDGLEIVADLRASITNTTILADIDSLESEFESLNSTSTSQGENILAAAEKIDDAIDNLITKIEAEQGRMTSAKVSVEKSVQDLSTLKSNLATIISDIDSIKQELEKSSQGISSISITSSDQIVNPITTHIETISSDNNQLIILFPYVLLLIVMFVGLLLSSTLVVVEKKSKAYFRVFTTPTRDEFYLLTTFFTAFIIVALQVAFVLIMMQFFFIDLITANLLVNLVLLIVSISIFIMIGMAIGYVMSNQQGTNMASISVGAIFLFISNIVLPLESISPYLKEVAKLNPYVLASEMLRQSILFDFSFTQMQMSLAILIAYTIIIAMVIIIVQGFAKNSFFKNIPHIKSKKKTINNSLLTIDNTVISSEKDLLEFVHTLSSDEFQSKIQKSLSVKSFISNVLNHKDIAKDLSKLSKPKFLKRFISKNEELVKEFETKSKRLQNKHSKKKE